MRQVATFVLLGLATFAFAKVDSKCQEACGARGYTANFCTRMCTYDPAKGESTPFGIMATPDPPVEPPKPPPAPRWQPPTASLVPVNPVEDELRDEVRKLKAENAALRRELVSIRRSIDSRQRRP